MTCGCNPPGELRRDRLLALMKHRRELAYRKAGYKPVTVPWELVGKN